MGTAGRPMDMRSLGLMVDGEAAQSSAVVTSVAGGGSSSVYPVSIDTATAQSGLADLFRIIVPAEDDSEVRREIGTFIFGSFDDGPNQDTPCRTSVTVTSC